MLPSLILGCAFAALPAQNKLDWIPDATVALETAAKEDKVIFVSLGLHDELRSETIRKKVMHDKAVIAQAALTLNVPAWAWELGEEKKLAAFGEAKPVDHAANLAWATTEWVQVNEVDAFALPQHLWLNAKGEVLLSVPWELDADEMSWCFDEALRLAGVESRPPRKPSARAPRRLLMGETVQLAADDDFGRGLTDEELEQSMSRLKRGFVTARDRVDIGRVMFTPNEDVAEFLDQQIGLWDFGGAASAGLIDFVYGLVGLFAPMEHMSLLEKEVESDRASLRAIVAVSYEQIGHPDGLKAVKKGLKKEKDEAVRPEWVRALGACAPQDKAVAKQLMKLAEKDDNGLVRINAILACGHVLPQLDARNWLIDLAAEGAGEVQRAAVLALALGREQAARDLFVQLQSEAKEGSALAATVQQAIAVLDGANLHVLEQQVRELDGSPYPRPRLFYRAVTEVPGEGD